MSIEGERLDIPEDGGLRGDDEAIVPRAERSRS